MAILSQLRFVDNDQAGDICPLCRGRGQRDQVDNDTGRIVLRKCECQADQITDGPQWCPEAGEYARQLADGCFVWGETRAACNRAYFEAIRVQADHSRRCPDDIPFDGSLPEYIENGSPADYGLEVW